MRWNASNINFSRPIRWILALYGENVISFAYAGVASGRVSRGPRGSGSPLFEVKNSADYLNRIAEHGILLSAKERQAVIGTAASNLAEDVGGKIQDDPALMAEVVNLVEQPTLLRGHFDERFLELPAPVLVAVMKKHQRYFPVYDQTREQLLPFFITVRNGGSEFLAVVQSGNEHVIQARFADAEFFYKKDSNHKLEDLIPRLDTMTFQTELGSMLEKVRRLEKLAPIISDQLGMDSHGKEFTLRAASLSKADLASHMVVEMTSLQGIMGGLYAKQSGEEQAVAEAIAEQYEAVSLTLPGLALALADRLDSALGLFAAGLAPKGSNDPFGLRRAAIQIIANLVGNEVSFDLREALMAAGPLQPVPVDDSDINLVLDFINRRLSTYLQENGVRKSVVRAIVNVQGHNPYRAKIAAGELNDVLKSDGWTLLLDTYSRCVRITREQPQYSFQSDKTVLPQEKKLYEVTVKSLKRKDGTIDGLVGALRDLEPYITDFFENVLVMDENLDVRENRLALLQMITSLADGIADLSELEGF
jgi:glycyl-tRNA synthetase